MNFEDIIKNEYRELTKSLADVLKNNTNYIIEIVINPNDNIMDIFDDNNKKILTIQYEVLGTYSNNLGIFSWACDNIVGNKEIIELSKNTKKYSKNLKKLIIENNFEDVKFLERLYYYLSNNMFFIDNKNINDIITISVFVTKTLGVVKSNNTSNKNITTFYLVTDIMSY